VCRVDDGDCVDVYEVEYPVARVDHRCGECRRTIMAGEPYERHHIVADGSATTHIVCSHCGVLEAWLLKECGGTVTHELIEDIEEHALEYDRQDLRELAELERLVREGILSHDIAGPAIAEARRRLSSPLELPWPSPQAWRETAMGMRTILTGEDVPAARAVLERILGVMPCHPAGPEFVVAKLRAREVWLATGTGGRWNGSGGVLPVYLPRSTRRRA